MTEIVRARSGAEFLALVPHVAGFSPRNSLICMMFRGSRTAGALRFDLPTRHRDADFRALADVLIATARRGEAIDRVALIVYTDSSFELEHGIPHLDLADYLSRRVPRRGFPLVGAFCVAPDGWGDYLDDASTRRRRPLSELHGTPAVSSWSPPPEFDELDSRPSSDPHRRDALDAAIVRVLERVGDCPVPSEIVETCLASEPSDDELASSAILVQAPSERDTAMLRIAFGELVGDAVADDNTRWLERQRLGGGSMDETVLREIAAGRENLDDEFFGLLCGSGRLRPDVERIRQALVVLGRLVVDLDPPSRPPLLCMLAWLNWAIGRASTASGDLAAALAIEPGYGMAEVLVSLIRWRQLPDWAFVDPAGVPR